VLTPLFSGESGVKRLLDVAGGSAVFSCSFAQRHPELSCTVLELPVVCRCVPQLRRTIDKFSSRPWCDCHVIVMEQLD
jgi:hypothetical protein